MSIFYLFIRYRCINKYNYIKITSRYTIPTYNIINIIHICILIVLNSISKNLIIVRLFMTLESINFVITLGLNFLNSNNVCRCYVLT